MLDRDTSNQSFLKRVMAGDESSIFQCDSETKRQSGERQFFIRFFGIASVEISVAVTASNSSLPLAHFLVGVEFVVLLLPVK
ncbi:hypothetical protein NPIL_596831 [Nephila pilipes]|uniref:Uncharacterized protein n=1 Tax=Nephila pilipes TaxID=299642 RepID=A0A8X6U7D0_NEPPI|nr:hypothetical protein NPIL_596831 [Nephila pilipes]